MLSLTPGISDEDKDYLISAGNTGITCRVIFYIFYFANNYF